MKRIAFSLVPVVLLVAVLETASYAYYSFVLADDFMAIDISDSFHNIPDLFERRRIGDDDILFSRYFPTRYYVSDRNYRGKIMAAAKTPNIYRVFAFGGSSTAGSPWGHEASFSRFLEDELNAIRRAGTRVEVVNFGGGGYGSTRALGLVEASIAYQPDLVVFYEGHNEMSDNWIYRDAARDGVNTGIRRIANHSYTFRVARSLLRSGTVKPAERVDLLKSNASFIPQPIADKRGFKKSDRAYLAAQFRENLFGIVRAARAHGAQVLLVSQPSNLFYEPSWFGGAGDVEEQKLVDELRAAYDKGDLALVEERSARLLQFDADNPLAHFFAGLAAAQRRDASRAREHLLAAIDLDENPERFTRAYRDIERELQSEPSGVFFVDAWQAAGDFLDDGLVDGRLFADKMHPAVEGNKLIARTIMDEYFVRRRVRPELFDYSLDNPERIWSDNIDAGFYHVICARYFDIGDPSRCIDEVERRYESAPAGSPAQHIYRSSWEYLFYYALRTNDTSWLQKSAAIYDARSLRDVAPHPTVLEAAHQ